MQETTVNETLFDGPDWALQKGITGKQSLFKEGRKAALKLARSFLIRGPLIGSAAWTLNLQNAVGRLKVPFRPSFPFNVRARARKSEVISSQ